MKSERARWSDPPGLFRCGFRVERSGFRKPLENGRCAAALLTLPLLVAGCMTAAPPEPRSYRALGQEPGWSLDISGGRMIYIGDYGGTRIEVPTPAPSRTVNGHRYEAQSGAHRLRVDVTHRLCHDAMSGHAFEDIVAIVADGVEVRGCGGARLPAKDM
jgi:heat shock protein HslJ